MDTKSTEISRALINIQTAVQSITTVSSSPEKIDKDRMKLFLLMLVSEFCVWARLHPKCLFISRTETLLHQNGKEQEIRLGQEAIKSVQDFVNHAPKQQRISTVEIEFIEALRLSLLQGYKTI